MADPKKNPLIGAFRAPVPGAPPDTPAPPEAGKPPAAGAAKPIDEKKGQEAPKAPAGTTPKPADGKKEPEAPKAPADTSAKPADGKKEPEAPKAPADPLTKPTNEKKGPEAPKAPADTSAKPADGKKEPEAPKAPADPLTKPTNEKKGPEAPKAPADTSAKPADGKKGQEAPKAPADTPAKPTNEKKGQEEPKAPTDTSAKPADGKKSPVSDPSKPKDEKEQEPRSPDLRFVALSKIKPLPGTYVKDEPRKDYSGLIADIKKNGLQKPVILRKSEKEDEFQLVDGFHRCKALEQAGMLEVRADVYRRVHGGGRDRPGLPHFFRLHVQRFPGSGHQLDPRGHGLAVHRGDYFQYAGVGWPGKGCRAYCARIVRPIKSPLNLRGLSAKQQGDELAAHPPVALLPDFDLRSASLDLKTNLVIPIPHGLRRPALLHDLPHDPLLLHVRGQPGADPAEDRHQHQTGQDGPVQRLLLCHPFREDQVRAGGVEQYRSQFQLY